MHQELWNVLDELDETARILDPINPTRKRTKRRILLSNFVTVQIAVSVQHPRSLPQCQFLGASQPTRPLIATLTEKYQEWDTDRSIVNNLESILGVTVVRKSSKQLDGSDDEEEEDWGGGECVVCYSLHLQDKLPERTCDQCHKSFHLECLYEWLRGLPTSRQRINLIFGECPYCTKAKSCKIPA
ncbi:E3 ubiquitin-protein ligase FANCL-like [Oratosquilla oratoria]|uniref:E3 ubiquitin-protein ligase FANCL-like n=1 Tax=Oratosquilla oratoria TaxID=337810 RepID=UPI003F76E094